jgi:hypothetical protein
MGELRNFYLRICNRDLAFLRLLDTIIAEISPTLNPIFEIITINDTLNTNNSGALIVHQPTRHSRRYQENG